MTFKAPTPLQCQTCHVLCTDAGNVSALATMFFLIRTCTSQRCPFLTVRTDSVAYTDCRSGPRKAIFIGPDKATVSIGRAKSDPQKP